MYIMRKSRLLQLEALSELAQSIRTATKMRLSVNVTGLEEPRHFNIDDDNYLLMQTQVVSHFESFLNHTFLQHMLC